MKIRNDRDQSAKNATTNPVHKLKTRINGYTVFLKESGAFVRNSKISISEKLIRLEFKKMWLTAALHVFSIASVSVI